MPRLLRGVYPEPEILRCPFATLRASAHRKDNRTVVARHGGAAAISPQFLEIATSPAAPRNDRRGFPRRIHGLRRPLLWRLLLRLLCLWQIKMGTVSFSGFRLNRPEVSPPGSTCEGLLWHLNVLPAWLRPHRLVPQGY